MITLEVSIVNAPLVVIDTPLTKVLPNVYEAELITQSALEDVAIAFMVGKA